MGQAKDRQRELDQRPYKGVCLGGELNGRMVELPKPFPEVKVNLELALKDPARRGLEAVYRLAGTVCESCRVAVYRYDTTRKAIVVARECDIPELPASLKGG